MAIPRRLKTWQDRMRDPALTVLLVVQLLSMFVLTPLAATGLPIPRAVVNVLLVAVIAVVLVITRSRAAIALALISVTLSVVGEVLRVTRPSQLNNVIGHGGTILGLSTLAWVVARAVFAGGRVNIYRIFGAIVLYLNFAIIFSAAYRLVFELAPDAFKGVPSDPGPIAGSEQGILATMLYFSFTTLTSTGFGDIVPVHPLARSLANLEAIIGQLYPATLLARVVTLEMQFRRPPRNRDR
jgi:hypothetical protein